MTTLPATHPALITARANRAAVHADRIAAADARITRCHLCGAWIAGRCNNHAHERRYDNHRSTP